MRLLTSFLALVLASALLTGCLGNDAPTSESDPIEQDSIAPPVTTPIVKKTPIGVTLAQDLFWVKPGTPVTFTATATGAAGSTLSYAWKYGLRAPSTSAPALNTGNIAPGAFSDLTFNDEGVYAFHCHPHPWMKLNITVKAGASAALAHVAILDGKTLDTFRFDPLEITIAPGAKIRFHNNGSAVHTATQEGVSGILTEIPGTGNQVTFDFPKAGDYRVLVTVKDGAKGEGQAETRLLADENVPADTYEATFKDDFQANVPGTEEATGTTTAKHPFTLAYDGDLAATLAVTSDTPVPAQVTVVLYAAGSKDPIAKLEAVDKGQIAAALPAGSYVFEVTGVQGAQYHSALSLAVKMKLTIPEPDTGGEGGEHGGGHQH